MYKIISFKLVANSCWLNVYAHALGVKVLQDNTIGES